MESQKNKVPEEILVAAKQFYRQGAMHDAASTLSGEIEKYPEDAEGQFLYAAALLLSDRYAEAVAPFERVLQIEPRNERASLGLFHSLWKMERCHEALMEARRFFRDGGESMEYRRLFKGMIRSYKEAGID